MRYSLKRSRWPDNIHQIDSGRHEKHRDREAGSLPSIDVGALNFVLSSDQSYNLTSQFS